MKKPSELPEYTVIRTEEHGIIIRTDRDRWSEVKVFTYQRTYSLEEVDTEGGEYTLLALPVEESQ